MEHMIGCVAVAGVALTLAFGFGDNRPAWVPFLLVLCCAVMMAFVMLAMHREHDDHLEASKPEHTPQT